MSGERKPRAPRRHPAEITADRLGDAVMKWAAWFDPEDRDAVGRIIATLDEIAQRELL